MGVNSKMHESKGFSFSICISIFCCSFVKKDSHEEICALFIILIITIVSVGYFYFVTFV